MEDVVIGRQSYSRFTPVAVPAGGNGVMIGADPLRTFVAMTPGANNAFYVSDKPMTAVDQGIRVNSNATVVTEFPVEHYGNFVLGQIFLWCAVAQVVGVIEVSLAREK